MVHRRPAGSLRKHINMKVRVSNWRPGSLVGREALMKTLDVGQTVDVSEAGMQVQINLPLKRMDLVMLGFTFPAENRLIAVDAEVRWARPCRPDEGGIGFRVGFLLMFRDPDTANYYSQRAGGGSMIMV